MNLKAINGKMKDSILYIGSEGGCFEQDMKIDPSDNYLIADIINMEETCVPINFAFWSDKNEPDVLIKCGIFPKVKTHIVLPLKHLDGQQFFIIPKGIELKTLVLGIRADRNKIKKIGIKTEEYHKDIKLKVDSFYLSSDFIKQPNEDIKIVDDLGQWKWKEWEGKTRSIEEFSSYIKSELEKSKKFSGFNYNTDMQFDATGFFRIEKFNSRFYMVTPDGKPFFSSGIDCIRCDVSSRCDGLESYFDYLPIDDLELVEKTIWHTDKKVNTSVSFAASNFKRAFGVGWREYWQDYVKYKIRSWGFNTVAAWSNPNFIKHSNMPYTVFLKGFPTTKNNVYRDFPDVFSEEYLRNSKEYAKQLEEYKNDKNVIGYFMSNEPNFVFAAGLNIACEVLKNKLPLKCKDKLIEFYMQKYNGDIKTLNNKWETDFSSFDDLKHIDEDMIFSEKASDELCGFSKVLIEQYIKVPALSLKEIDKNHLNLGIRFAFISSDTLFAGAEYLDVFSINCYDYNCSDKVRYIHENTGKPVIIGEYHFGSTDRGLPATGIRAAKNQQQRAVAAKFYLENAIANPYCVGVHYFQLYDQSILGRPDGENYQIGLLDVCSKEYKEITEAYKQTHGIMYDIMSGKRKPTDEKAEKTIAILY